MCFTFRQLGEICSLWFSKQLGRDCLGSLPVALHSRTSLPHQPDSAHGAVRSVRATPRSLLFRTPTCFSALLCCTVSLPSAALLMLSLQTLMRTFAQVLCIYSCIQRSYCVRAPYTGRYSPAPSLVSLCQKPCIPALRFYTSQTVRTVLSVRFCAYTLVYSAPTASALRIQVYCSFRRIYTPIYSSHLHTSCDYIGQGTVQGGTRDYYTLIPSWDHLLATTS